MEGKMLGVKPYLAFGGNCEEAINFYKECLGGEILYIGRYGDSPMKGQGPDNAVMHCSLKIGDTVIMASDNLSEEHPITVGNNISLAVGSGDIAQAESMFEKMSAGGKVTMPIQETFWAERFGMLTDKFGINWMFNVDKPHPDKAEATA
jgi:PhnB protein